LDKRDLVYVNGNNLDLTPGSPNMLDIEALEGKARWVPRWQPLTADVARQSEAASNRGCSRATTFSGAGSECPGFSIVVILLRAASERASLCPSGCENEGLTAHG